MFASAYKYPSLTGTGERIPSHQLATAPQDLPDTCSSWPWSKVDWSKIKLDRSSGRVDPVPLPPWPRAYPPFYLMDSAAATSMAAMAAQAQLRKANELAPAVRKSATPSVASKRATPVPAAVPVAAIPASSAPAPAALPVRVRRNGATQRRESSPPQASGSKTAVVATPIPTREVKGRTRARPVESPPAAKRERAAAREPVVVPEPTDNEDDDGPPYICKVAFCHSKFNRRYELDRHMPLHAEGQSYITCGVCGSKFRGGRKDALRRHQLDSRKCRNSQNRLTDNNPDLLRHTLMVTEMEQEKRKKKAKQRIVQKVILPSSKTKSPRRPPARDDNDDNDEDMSSAESED